MKTWILKNKLALTVLTIGAITGFIYWNFIGCASGHCGITANWYTSAGYGAMMGWFIGDFVNDKKKK